MGEWTGRETSDITYDDAEGVLTRWLVDEGHLRSDIWAGARLKYSIEVKTTPDTCETPFYMSMAQYVRVCLPRIHSRKTAGSDN